MAAGRIWAVGHSWLHSALQARAGRGGPRRAVVVVQVNYDSPGRMWVGMCGREGKREAEARRLWARGVYLVEQTRGKRRRWS